jgi:site-specific recombinase XerD
MSEWFDNGHPGGPSAIAVPANLSRSKTKSESPSEMSRDQAHNYFKDTLADTKWDVVRGWHVLRHSFCSNCARQGVPDQVIDAWMGHQGNEAIKKRYRHLFPSDQRQFMDNLFIDSKASHFPAAN